jgi:hypothetical protein
MSVWKFTSLSFVCILTMLPDILAGSYQRYKSDTNVFTTWLSATATKCGYKLPKSAKQEPSVASGSQPPRPSAEPAASERTLTLAEKLRAQAERKAKKREEKKIPAVKSTEVETELAVVQTTKHTVKTQDLLRQAEAVAKSSKFKIPDAIAQVVERAIQARRRCAVWFQQTGVDNGFSTEGHLHFIGVLEEALKILKPDFGGADANQKRFPEAEKRKEPPPSFSMSNNRQDLSGLSNRFSNLDVEDAEDIVDSSTALVSLSATGTSAQKNASIKPVDVYELEYDNALDRIFDVFCFFEDLHRIQDFLSETWKQQKAGTLDLMTATFVTNAALDIVRREEESVREFALPKLAKSGKLSYKDLLLLVFFADALGITDMGGLPTGLRITPFDNFVYLPTARTLVKFEKFSAMKIRVFAFFYNV